MGACLSSNEDPGHGMHAAPVADDGLATKEAVDIVNGHSECTSQMDVRLACKQLRHRDGPSGKSDPFCVLFERDRNTGVWMERGRTEVQENQTGVLLLNRHLHKTVCLLGATYRKLAQILRNI
jgi:hypothetical protein